MREWLNARIADRSLCRFRSRLTPGHESALPPQQRLSLPSEVNQLTSLTALRRMGARLCIMLAVFVCALSPSVAQSNLYGDAADDGFGGRLPIAVNQLADMPASRQSEPRRLLLIANGQFVRGGYSLAEIPRPLEESLRSAGGRTPPSSNDHNARGLAPSAPDRPPNG